ncbi:HAMP domain-containing histidine kinase [Cyanobium sp. Cruz CV13-4-11]|jgi:signal transduction histidine kinase|uniref:sensor histidine kinase n=1 Tax=unclassified Cyanobium TaxID=2627006 RepID=UPI0020CE71B1|nr:MULTISPECIES: histidine kinase dimerization/phospho-acceptor domain-containing protein [unclassified Cyanobium]MCP9901120.1 HAMP domain-containing histidine kinase [Cyanobium sp. Cruz CV11-17]MCP9920260.1 HAMP domain-containing histidine kinase [Cyanobium sp. Cruz CV13-4-11]
MVVSLGELRSLLADGVPAGRGDEDSVRRQWWAALATVQEDLLGVAPPQPGVWLAAPLPALYEPALLEWLDGWVWTPAEVGNLMPSGLPLLPGLPPPPGTAPRGTAGRPGGFQRLSLREADGTDPLLVLITPVLQVALALDGPPQARRLVVRFEASILSAALELLDRRLAEDDPAAGLGLRRRLQLLGPLRNAPDLGTRFWPLLAQRLAAMAPSVTLQPLVHGEKRSEGNGNDAVSSELALLEALTHEVRTPLATIRTLIRSLLRRTDLPAVVRQRLEQIDGECSEQIDRFGLIFLAAELQRQPGSGQPLSDSELARTDLSRLLLQLEGLWQRQLGRRDLKLVLEIAADLPPVMSDPSRLETMLGGLMDRFSRSLPSGSEVRLRLLPAGSRLKLQLSSDDPESREDDGLAAAVPMPVGPVLSWNPETGSLQLSRQATQRLFHRLGGRLTERGGSNLTVFFPAAERSG